MRNEFERQRKPTTLLSADLNLHVLVATRVVRRIAKVSKLKWRKFFFGEVDSQLSRNSFIHHRNAAILEEMRWRETNLLATMWWRCHTVTQRPQMSKYQIDSLSTWQRDATRSRWRRADFQTSTSKSHIVPNGTIRYRIDRRDDNTIGSIQFRLPEKIKI